MKIGIILLIMLSVACVKEEGKVSDADSSSGGTTSGSGGGTTGSPATGSDPLASQAWHLKNTGQNAFSDSFATSGKDISVDYVHNTLDIRGRGVRIAVSDTGTDITHADLTGNTLAGEHRNYTLPLSTDWLGTSPTPPSSDNHGTGVAGLIAALGWNNIGSRGVAPAAKFAAFRYIYGASTETTESRLAKNIDQTYGNFDIFNYSYGKFYDFVFFTEDQLAKDAIELGVRTLRDGKGAIYVQSAGNGFAQSYDWCEDPTDPACPFPAPFLVTGNVNSDEGRNSPFKIVVGALNADGKVTSYSTPGSALWISAPGGEDGFDEPAMITTDITGCSSGMSFRRSSLSQYFDFGFNTLNANCDYTNRFNGTSSAAPVVSGVVALMLEANPNLSWRDVKHILASTADRVDFNPFDPILNIMDHPRGYDLGPTYVYDEVWKQNFAGYWFSNTYGFGGVNAQAAVLMARSYNTNTLGTFVQTKNSSDTWYYSSGALSGIEPLDEDPSGIEDRIWVGHNYIVESVQIQLTTDHPYPGDLAVHLISPSGTESRLLNLNSKLYGEGLEADFTLLSNAFYGEESQGYWKLKLVDGDSTFGTGELLNWKILVNGRRKSTDLNKPLPPTFITLSAVPLSDSMSPVFFFTESETSPIFFYEAAVGLTPDDEIISGGWQALDLTNPSQQMTGLLPLNDGQTYYLKIRARNSGGYSSVQVKSWEANTI